MELKLFIEKAAVVAGDQKTLARAMGITPDYLAHAKAGRRGLPLTACLAIAELLEIDPLLVIYASAMRPGKAGKKPAKPVSALKPRKSENLATRSMRLMACGAGIPAAESPTVAKRAEKMQAAFALINVSDDPANFYRLLLRDPPIPVQGIARSRANQDGK